MGSSIVRAGHDWSSAIAAAQREAGDDQAWARGIVRALEGAFVLRSEPTLAVVEHDAACSTARYRAVATPPGFEPVGEFEEAAGLHFLGIDGFRAFYYPARVVTTHREIEADLVSPDANEIRARAELFRARAGVTDVIGAFAYPEPGIVLSLYAFHDRALAPSRHERKLLARVMLGLEGSYRLRRRPESVVAILDANARVLERSPDAPADAVMASHVERRLASNELWPALVAGRVSIVPRGEGRSRRYFVLENAPQAQPFRALTEPEAAVLAQAARGHSTKLIAFALGVSSSAVSSRLTSAASKLGVATTMDLVRLGAMLARDPRAGFAEIALTDAERDVLDLVQRGLRNADIARMRSRSVRTIANQVASLLRKTKTGSRRELVASLPPR